MLPQFNSLLYVAVGALLAVVVSKLSSSISSKGSARNDSDRLVSKTPEVATTTLKSALTTSTRTNTTIPTTDSVPSLPVVKSLAISDPPTLRFQRFGKNELLLGIEHTQRIFQARVLIMGTGGVGSWVVESLARAGVGYLVLVDPGFVKISNCSQQIPALSSTLGRHKVEVLAERVREINPECEVIPYPFPVDDLTADAILTRFGPLDVVIDCADKITDKAAMIAAATAKQIPCIITTLGAATRLNPSLVRVGDVSTTSHCPVGKQIRKRLLTRGIRTGVTCVYSIERPRNRFMTSSDRMVDLVIESPASVTTVADPSLGPTERIWTPSPMGSWVVVPAMFGLYAAHHALMFLGQKSDQETGDLMSDTRKRSTRTGNVDINDAATNDRDLQVPWPDLDVPAYGFAHRRAQQLAEQNVAP